MEQLPPLRDRRNRSGRDPSRSGRHADARRLGLFPTLKLRVQTETPAQAKLGRGTHSLEMGVEEQSPEGVGHPPSLSSNMKQDMETQPIMTRNSSRS